VKDHRQSVGLILFSLILSSCIPIPTFEGEPFSDDVTNLKVSITTKKDVLDRLGEPGATFSQESEFVYTDFQSEVALLAPAGAGSIGKLHFLVLTFSEEDVLMDMYVRSGYGSHMCIDTGWCAGYQNRVMQLASYEQDARAKQFTLEGNQCGIYLYGHFSPTTVVTLDGKSTGNIFGKRIFQYFKVTPGAHELKFVREPGVKKRWGEAEIPPPFKIDCIEGEVVFIEVNKPYHGYSLIRQHDVGEGREEVQKRDLVIPGYARKIPSS